MCSRRQAGNVERVGIWVVCRFETADQPSIFYNGHMPFDFNETIRLAVEKISVDNISIRDHHNVERVLEGLEDRTGLLNKEEFTALVYETVEACERSGVKMPDAR